MGQSEQVVLQDLGLTLPPAPKAAANYRPCRISGNMAYLAGHGPFLPDGTLLHCGRLGSSTSSAKDGNAALLSVDEGYAAAKQVGLNILATLKNELGDLDRVEQVVKLFGIVQSADDFHEQHKVLNGCSDLMVQVFGPDRGSHARSAIGTNALPMDTSVEIEAIVQIKTTTT